MKNDVIVALSTPPMNAALAIIRVSGDDSIELVGKMFSKDLSKTSGNTLVYGNIIDKDTNTTIDEVILGLYRAPRSYTGENLIEINCHGGMFIVNRILQLLVKNGARLAERGEYTKRAFLNGKMDLDQAEAVHDMIMSTSESNVNVALNSLQGKTSGVVNDLEKELLDIRSIIEVAIDYPEYDEAGLATKETLSKRLGNYKKTLEKVLSDGLLGKIITDGVKVALVGKPNVGKSSILNALLNENKAIVTDIAGTTRDVVEGKINIDGITFNLYDTAGIRDTEDTVEKIGVTKSKEAITNADVVLLVLDNSSALDDEDKKMIKLTDSKKRIVVLNKTDKGSKLDIEGIKISATNNDVSVLKKKLVEAVGISFDEFSNKPMLSNSRQIGLLQGVLVSINNAIKNNENDMGIDLIATDLQEAYYGLLDILGQRKQDKIIDSIFSKFCLGK